MKHFLTLSAILLLTFYCIPAQSQNDFELLYNLDDIICKEAAHAEKVKAFAAESNPFAYQTDMHYQEMHWEIDPDVYFITGDITYYFKSLVDGLDTLILDFAHSMQVNSVIRNGNALSYTHTPDHLIRVHLNKQLSVGEFDTVRIQYEGMPPSNGFGSFEKGSHAGVPIIWTLSEPYGARDWWPAKQDLIDKIDSVDIFITTPIGQLAASNGKLMSITESNGSSVHHWKHRYPIVNYLIALSVTNYAAYSQYVPLESGDSIEMLNYVYPEGLTNTMTATESSVIIMQLFNELFGLYPFAEEKYGHAQFGWGGGEEHQTMSFMGSFGFDLQAHEMAHQWFGNKVTCGSWTDIWLNEGFATYLTGLTFENFSPDLYWPIWKNSTSNSATSQPGGSVFVTDTTDVGRIFNGRLSYQKGSYLVHMLRWVTGDSSFFKGCRNYLNSSGTAYDFGRTYELKDHLENESGKDLDGFFADWFYGEGYPSYDLRWTQQADSVIVWLGQRQSHPSVSFFEMPVPILLVVNDLPVIHRVDHSYQDQRFSFYTGDGILDSIGIDPDKWLLTRNNTIEEIITSVTDLQNDRYQIFPNPANDLVEIIPSADVSFASVIDLTGQIIKAELINGIIDVSLLPGGIYSVHLFDNDNKLVAVKKLAVMRP
jgi:aminopeptidase N